MVAGRIYYSLFASSVPVTYYNSIYAQAKSATNATYQLPQRSYLASTDLRHRSYALDSTLQVDATTTRSLQIIGKYAAFLFAGGLPSYNLCRPHDRAYLPAC